ncbi:MAG: flagellar basal body-associated FliL family protein [Phycisphaerae bacterium]|jgi:flagellar basal body-associated protein FliL
MADEVDTDKPAASAAKATGAGPKKLLFTLGLALGSIIISSVVGGVMGTLMGKDVPAQAQAADKPAAEAEKTPPEPAAEENAKESAKEGGHGDKAEASGPVLKEGELGYYDLESVTVNLDEPRLGRYVRATIVLAMEAKDFKAASEVLNKRKPDLKSWLTVYLAGCTVEDVRGPRNLNRIRNEIRDSFNEQLWPDRKPLVAKVLFKEFAVQ